MSGPDVRAAMNGSGAMGLATRIFWRLAGVGLVVAMFASTGLAADDNKIIFPGNATKAAPPAARGGEMLNTFTLLVAVAIAAVGAWVFWRNRKTTTVARESRLLIIEETRSLGNRQYLVVASYEDKKFLLGVCQGRIDLLSNLHAPESKEGGR